MLKLIVVVALGSGCSVALQAKPTTPRSASSDCSTSSTYWIADGVGLGVSGAAVVGGAAMAIANRDGNEETGYAVAAAGAVAAVIYYASMDNGRKWSRACSERAPVAAR